METTRRDFLKIGGAALASATVLGGFTQTSSASNLGPLRIDPAERYWAAIRDEYKTNRMHFNTGTTGSLPLFAQENLAEYNRNRALDPVSGLSAYPSLNVRRASIATWLGANTDEVYISNNTSDGMNAILLGIEWKAGDEIIMHQWEHGGGLGPAALVRDKYGVVLKMVEVAWPLTTKEAVVAAYEKGRTAKTKAMMLSGIAYKNGALLPHKELCTWARANGIISIIDGAHYTGHLDVNLHDIGCDFCAMSGHKWLSGVAGTGVCYIRNSWKVSDAGWGLPKYWPYRPQGWGTSYGAQAVFGTIDANRVRPPVGTYSPAASMQSVGDTNQPAFMTTADCADFCYAIGSAKYFARITFLSSYMKAAVIKKFGAAALLSADNPDFNTGLTMYNPFNDKVTVAKINLLNAALTARNIYSRTIDNRIKLGVPPYTSTGTDTQYAIRVSTHWQFCYPVQIEDYLTIVAEEVAKIGL